MNKTLYVSEICSLLTAKPNSYNYNNTINQIKNRIGHFLIDPLSLLEYKIRQWMTESGLYINEEFVVSALKSLIEKPLGIANRNYVFEHNGASIEINIANMPENAKYKVSVELSGKTVTIDEIAIADSSEHADCTLDETELELLRNTITDTNLDSYIRDIFYKIKNNTFEVAPKELHAKTTYDMDCGFFAIRGQIPEVTNGVISINKKTKSGQINKKNLIQIMLYMAITGTKTALYSGNTITFDADYVNDIINTVSKLIVIKITS